MTFDNDQYIAGESAQIVSVQGANTSCKGSGSTQRSSTFAAPKSILQNLESTLQPPFVQLSDRSELLPPFSVNCSSMGCQIPRSPGPGHHSRPVPSDISSRVMEAAQSMATLPQLRYFQPLNAYPSPVEPALKTFDKGLAAPFSSPASKVMPPPFSISSSARDTEYDASSERATKRVRLSAGEDLYQNQETNRSKRASSYSPEDVDDQSRPHFQPVTPNLVNPYATNPMTPASSSTNSDEVRQTWKLTSNSYAMQDRSFRRVSVNSLLSGSPELENARTMPCKPTQPYLDLAAISPLPNASSPQHRFRTNAPKEGYGLDQGLPDLDVPRNNDTAAINGITPSQHGDLDSWLDNVDLGVPEFGFGLQKREFVFAKGGYYAAPVAIKIPRSLEPLPSTLLENPMNLLYFHHFLNHTARILVVHDCSQNPFRTILPQSKITNYRDLQRKLTSSSGNQESQPVESTSGLFGVTSSPTSDPSRAC